MYKPTFIHKCERAEYLSVNPKKKNCFFRNRQENFKVGEQGSVTPPFLRLLWQPSSRAGQTKKKETVLNVFTKPDWQLELPAGFSRVAQCAGDSALRRFSRATPEADTLHRCTRYSIVRAISISSSTEAKTSSTLSADAASAESVSSIP